MSKGIHRSEAILPEGVEQIVQEIDDPYRVVYGDKFPSFEEFRANCIAREPLYTTECDPVDDQRAILRFSGPFCPIQEIDLTVLAPVAHPEDWRPLLLTLSRPVVGVDLNPHLDRNNGIPLLVVPSFPASSWYAQSIRSIHDALQNEEDRYTVKYDHVTHQFKHVLRFTNTWFSHHALSLNPPFVTCGNNPFGVQKALLRRKVELFVDGEVASTRAGTEIRLEFDRNDQWVLDFWDWIGSNLISKLEDTAYRVRVLMQADRLLTVLDVIENQITHREPRMFCWSAATIRSVRTELVNPRLIFYDEADLERLPGDYSVVDIEPLGEYPLEVA